MSSSSLPDESNKRLRSTPLTSSNFQDDIKKWFCAPKDHGIQTLHQCILARGGFGEIHLGIQTQQQQQHKLVAIKTIPQALVAAGGRQPSSFSGGLMGWSNNDYSDSQTSTSTSTQIAPQLTREVFQEICALRLLERHPNIATLLAVFPSTDLPGALSLAFPYSPLDLHTALEFRQRQLPPVRLLPLGVIRAVAHDLFSALQHCHAHGVLHRDVTPGNLLISYHGIVQLTDFGLAKPFTSSQLIDNPHSIPSTRQNNNNNNSSKGLCTLYYRPPEVLLGGSSANPSVDVYSAGLVLAELVSGGQPLFPGRNVIDQLGLVFRVLGTPTESHWPEATLQPDYGKLIFSSQSPKPWNIVLPRLLELDHMESVMISLVALDPMKRWSAETALQSYWFQGKRAGGQQVAELLVPVQLGFEPLLLWENDQNHAIRQAQAVAATRRSLLSLNTIPWQE